MKIELAGDRKQGYQIQKCDGCILYPGNSLDLEHEELKQLYRLLKKEFGGK